MKTKIVFLICLFFSIGLTQLSAQNSNPDGTKSLQGWLELTGSYYAPVYCGDEMIDYLQGGVISIHIIDHYKEYRFQFEILQIKGTVTSKTGEVFEISEIDKYYFTDAWYVTWHFNLKGNRGSHYIGIVTINLWTGNMVIEKALCP